MIFCKDVIDVDTYQMTLSLLISGAFTSIVLAVLIFIGRTLNLFKCESLEKFCFESFFPTLLLLAISLMILKRLYAIGE